MTTSIDDLSKEEFNRVVNKMFGNEEDELLTKYMPWDENWFCCNLRNEKTNMGGIGREVHGSTTMEAQGNALLNSKHLGKENVLSGYEKRLRYEEAKQNLSSPFRNKLGSVYGPSFQKSEVLDAAKKAGATPRRNLSSIP